MQHRYSIKLIAYILLFNHSLMSCYNPSLSHKKQYLTLHPEDAITNEPIEYTTSTAFMTLEPVRKPTDLGTNTVFMSELFIGSKLTALGNIESKEETIEAPSSFQLVAFGTSVEEALRIKNKGIESEEEAIEEPISCRLVAFGSPAEEALRIKKDIESEEEAIEEPISCRLVAFGSPAEEALRIKKSIESEEEAIEEPISFRLVAFGSPAEEAIEEKNTFRRVSFESRAEGVVRLKKALEREAAGSRQRKIAREEAVSRKSASSSPRQGLFAKLWGAVCNVGRSIWQGCKKAFNYSKILVPQVCEATKRSIWHGCKKAFNYAKPLIFKVYQTALKSIFNVVSHIIHGFKKAVTYAKKNIWPKVCKVIKFIYNRIVKPVSKFIGKHKKPILIGTCIFLLVAFVVCYPYIGIPPTIATLSTILFGKNATSSDKKSSTTNQGSTNWLQFIVEYFQHRNQENEENKPRAAVTRSIATVRSAPRKAVASQGAVGRRHYPSWQESYTKLRDFAGSIKNRVSEFGGNLVDKASKVGSWFKKQSSPTSTFVSPHVSPPIPTPTEESSEASHTAFSQAMANPEPANDSEPKTNQGLEEEQVEEGFQDVLEEKEVTEEATEIEAISFDNLEEANLAAEAYLESFRQADSSQQAELRQKGMALLRSIEGLKKVTKDQYRTTGKSLVFAELDEHSFPLFVAQRKGLHTQYVGFKALRNQLRGSMSLTQAESRACGLRMRPNAETGQEEYYSSSEEQDWSDQSIRIKQAVGSGIGSGLKNQVKFIIPSIVRLALDPKGTVQAYMALLQAIPQLPELVKAYYDEFQDFNEEEKAEALSQLLTEIVLTLLPMPKLSVGQIASLSDKLGKAGKKAVQEAAKIARLGEKWHPTLEKIFRPNGKLIGTVEAGDELIRTVSYEEGQAIIKQLMAAGAKKIAKATYDNTKKDGTWYTIPGLGEFGIRKTTHILSTKHNVELNIDVKELNIGLEKIKIEKA